MGYEKILKELGYINDTGISMKALRKLAGLFQSANTVYGVELFAKREDSKERYHEVIEQIKEVAFDKLKNKLDFEDEVIEKIISLMMMTNKIEEIYVIDGMVLTRLENVRLAKEGSALEKLDDASKSEEKDALYSSSSGVFYNINSKSFIDIENDYFKHLVIGSLNALVGKNDTNADIYVNHTLSELYSDNTGSQISKVIIKCKDEILYYDLKIRDDYVITSQNEYRVNVLSEMLDSNDKVYKK